MKDDEGSTVSRVDFMEILRQFWQILKELLKPSTPIGQACELHHGLMLSQNVACCWPCFVVWLSVC